MRGQDNNSSLPATCYSQEAVENNNEPIFPDRQNQIPPYVFFSIEKQGRRNLRFNFEKQYKLLF